jgi:hypothetical protein
MQSLQVRSALIDNRLQLLQLALGLLGSGLRLGVIQDLGDGLIDGVGSGPGRRLIAGALSLFRCPFDRLTELLV